MGHIVAILYEKGKNCWKAKYRNIYANQQPSLMEV